MSCTRPQRIKMLGKDSSHSFRMTMRVISNQVRDPSLIPFSKEHTKDTKFGKKGDLISSLTYVIFVPFVVSHCSRTLRLGAPSTLLRACFAGDSVYCDDSALTRF